MFDILASSAGTIETHEPWTAVAARLSSCVWCVFPLCPSSPPLPPTLFIALFAHPLLSLRSPPTTLVSAAADEPQHIRDADESVVH
ncbi:hypothetical protein DFH09DRAFT_1351001 [Mycena vulgaris]|nr:hypothetical protein DFH09DRAFT_1351001 [Mycena vulgaris]